MWAFANTHVAMYRPLIEQWNKTHPDARTYLLQLSINVEQQRMVSSSYSDTPIADLMEIERGRVGAIFAGPVDKIALVDLTERIKKEGILDQINAPSFGPWSTRGHIFGLPHDVHPCMLAYRSDIVEAAGIDVSTIETWDDYVRVMKPLMNEKDADGKPKHYLLNLWPTSVNQIEMLLLQAGGQYLDADGNPALDSDAVARVISQVVVWTTGPNRIAADAPEFDQGANQMRVQGYIIGSLVPDWMTGVWKQDIPGLAGKVKLMPIPAWEKGGRRTSVWGGTMLAISKRTPDFEKAWALAKYLYLNPVVAETLYRKAGIISPVKKMWSNPIYDEPDKYFSGQPSGRLFINLATQVPLRTSSPFQTISRERLMAAVSDLVEYANAQHIYEVEKLLPKAHDLLHGVDDEMRRLILRSQLVDEGGIQP